MKVLETFIFAFLSSMSYDQTVEVPDQLKISTVNQNNNATDESMKNADGTVTKRDAASIETQGTAVGVMKYWNGPTHRPRHHRQSNSGLYG
jgi:hypothetical protein